MNNLYTSVQVNQVRYGCIIFCVVVGGVLISISNFSYGSEAPGMLTLDDGRVYVGEIADRKANGVGVLEDSKGYSLKGKFVDNKPQGRMIFKTPRSSEFYLYYRNGKKVGEMIPAYPLDAYIGEVNEIEQRHGRGYFVYGDKEYYSGQWRDNMMHGEGVYRFSSGTIYVGSFKKDNRYGYGVLRNVNGSMYAGEWDNNEYHGTGVEIDNEGSIYQGEFYRGRRSGKGRVIFNDGSIFDGIFRNNKPIEGKCSGYKSRDSLCHLIENKISPPINKK